MNTRLILIIALSTLILSITHLPYVQAPPGGHLSAIQNPKTGLGNTTKSLEQKQEDSNIVRVSYVLVIMIAVALLIFFKKRRPQKKIS